MSWKTVRFAAAILCVCPWSFAADDVPQPVTVLGVTLARDANGDIAAVDEQRRQQLVTQLRAAYSAVGVAAHSSPVRIGADGHQAITIGLDQTPITLARINQDGTLDTFCVKGAEAAAAVLAAHDQP